MFDILETPQLGKDNAAALDPNIFTDDNERRNGAHCGAHKRRVCFKEAKGASKCNTDLWTGCAVGEELIVGAI
eukprot:804883-Pyramimonas_sp.AAC.1